MMWSFLGLFLFGLGFPKRWLTERKLPYPPQHTYEPGRSWTHNCKDDLTDHFDDRKGGDRQWWLGFIGFSLYTQLVLIILLLVLA